MKAAKLERSRRRSVIELQGSGGILEQEMISSPSNKSPSPIRDSNLTISLESASDWQQKMNREGILEEVVEDALVLEDQKAAATKALNALADKTGMIQAKAVAYDERLRTMKTFFIIQSICGLFLAGVILHIHSAGSYAIVSEISYLSTFLVMVATILLVCVVGGSVSDVLPVMGKWPEMVKFYSGEIQHALLLLQGALEGTSEDISDVESLDAFSLPREQWAEPDATAFMVRSKSYVTDKKKQPSAPALFKLIAVDMCEVPTDKTRNIAAHPRNRVAKMREKNDHRFVFVFSFLIPGPPFLAYTAYWEVDRRLIETDKTAFGRVARPFFFGDSDEFRNERFKFLPKVVEGNFAIKMAVKDTPVLMGKKLTQYYFRGDNYFEIDVDISSSSVARSVTGLVIGYARTLVIDMALCIEGTNEDELPEVVIGTCSAVNVDVLCAKEM